MALNSLSFASASGLQNKSDKIVESETTSSYLDSFNLQINFRQTLKAPTDLSTEELDNLITTMNITGWKYNGLENIFERLVNYAGLDVAVNEGEESTIFGKTDAEGRVVLASPLGNKLNLEITDPESKLNFKQEIATNHLDSGSVTFDLDYTSMLESDDNYILKYDDSVILPMASTTNPYWSAGEKGVVGYRLHCNRFNGPSGDNAYHSHFSAQGLINFVGSDCDTSASVTLACIADDIPFMTNHCEAGIAPNKPNSKEATCSGDQGLSRYFHFRK